MNTPPLNRPRRRGLAYPIAVAIGVVGVTGAGGVQVGLLLVGVGVAIINGWFGLRLLHLAILRGQPDRAAFFLQQRVTALLARPNGVATPWPKRGLATGSPPLGREHSGVETKTLTLLGTGLFAVAGAGGALAVRSFRGRPVETAVYVILCALFVAGLAFIFAMALLPASSASAMTKARRVFDGLAVGVCLLLTAWLVVLPHGRLDGVGFWLALLVSCALPVAAFTGLRTAGPAAWPVAVGAGLASVGLAGLALTLMTGGSALTLAAFAAVLSVAPIAIWTGVRSHVCAGGEPERLTAPPSARAGEDDGSFAVHPILTIPAAVAGMVALHRLVTGGHFDRPSVALGISAVVTVAMRELLASVDLSRYARRVAEQAAQLASLISGAADAIMILDDELIVRWQSPAAASQLQIADGEALGRLFQSMVHPEDGVYVADRLEEVRGGSGQPVLFEARLRDGQGAYRETESAVSDLRHVPAVGGLVVQIRDVSQRKSAERALHRIAFADQLTGLANRRQLLLAVLAQRCVPRARGALLLLSLGGLVFGRAERPEEPVLVEVARRLRAEAGATALPARLGPTEFALLTEVSPVQAYALANRLLSTLAEPIVAAGGRQLCATVAIGLTDLAAAATPQDVLRRAELALRRAGQLGGRRVEWYGDEVEHAVVRRSTLEAQLPNAISAGQLDLIYQPILDLAGPEPIAVEALLRWRHPSLGTLLPADILPIVADLGLDAELGAWVLAQAGRQFAQWHKTSPNLSMSINVSVCQLLSAQFMASIRQTLARYELRPDRLVLELAEGGLGADTAAVARALAQVRSIGVRTALDEFGTGPDSMTHLHRLPIDMVKIGRQFLVGEESIAGDLPVMDSMVSVGRRLGIEVVAQGLEVPVHLVAARAAGCRFGQGHLLARPAPAERVEAYLAGFLVH